MAIKVGPKDDELERLKCLIEDTATDIRLFHSRLMLALCVFIAIHALAVMLLVNGITKNLVLIIGTGTCTLAFVQGLISTTTQIRQLASSLRN